MDSTAAAAKVQARKRPRSTSEDVLSTRLPRKLVAEMVNAALAAQKPPPKLRVRNSAIVRAQVYAEQLLIRRLREAYDLAQKVGRVTLQATDFAAAQRLLEESSP